MVAIGLVALYLALETASWAGGVAGRAVYDYLFPIR